MKQMIHQLDRMRNLMRLQESQDLAMKMYGGTMAPEALEYIRRLTGGDAHMKAMCDLYSDMMEHRGWEGEDSTRKKLQNFYQQLKTYNVNTFPIKDYDVHNSKGVLNAYLLEQRDKCLQDLSRLPSVAVRNLRHEIRQPRDLRGFIDYAHGLEYFMANFSLLDNRSDEMKEVIYRKMFKKGVTLDALLNFVEEKSNLLGGSQMGRSDMLETCQEYPGDLRVVLVRGNTMVVDVMTPDGIKTVGCMSTWCFTYGRDNWRQWDQYSTNSHVYVVVDFEREPGDRDFMYVLIGPLTAEMEDPDSDDTTLYDAANEPVTQPLHVLNALVGQENLGVFSFEDE